MKAENRVLFGGEKGFRFGVVLLALVLAVGACGVASADRADLVPLGIASGAQAQGSGQGRGRPAAPVEQSGDLTVAEAEGLVFMREEEKLARDVYLALYDEWGLGIFQNISTSEQQHMDAVLTLMETYGLDDPAAGAEQGEFENAELQALYDELVTAGSASLEAALRVGAAIEEIDILDLDEYSAQTDRDDLLRVYDNLTRGSRNHLRSFVSTLERQTGETYVPQYMSQDAYDAIVAGETETGGAGQGGGRGNVGGGKGRGGGRP
jgi:hypothetical protein